MGDDTRQVEVLGSPFGFVGVSTPVHGSGLKAEV